MTVESSATFDVPAAVLYHTLLNKEDLMRMTRSPASISPTIDSDWSLFAGSVTGKIKALDENKQIVQSWRFSNWSENIYSEAVISFDSISPSATKVKVIQTGIPSHDKYGNAEQVRLCLQGWEDKYWTGIEKMLGYPRNRDV